MHPPSGIGSWVKRWKLFMRFQRFIGQVVNRHDNHAATYWRLAKMQMHSQQAVTSHELNKNGVKIRFNLVTKMQINCDKNDTKMLQTSLDSLNLFPDHTPAFKARKKGEMMRSLNKDGQGSFFSYSNGDRKDLNLTAKPRCKRSASYALLQRNGFCCATFTWNGRHDTWGIICLSLLFFSREHTKSYPQHAVYIFTRHVWQDYLRRISHGCQLFHLAISWYTRNVSGSKHADSTRSTVVNGTPR